MDEILSDEIKHAWHFLLQELEMAKNNHMPYTLQAGGSTFRNPVTDYLLPPLLHIRLTSLLDEALTFYINHYGYRFPIKPYRDDLCGRIEFLNDQGVISNYDSLHKIRQQRNLIAHRSSEETNWETLEVDFNMVESELQSMGFIGERAHYEFFGERSKMYDNEDPEIAFSQDYKFGVKCDDKVTMEMAFTRHTHRVGKSKKTDEGRRERE